MDYELIIREPRHAQRWRLAAGACAVVLLMGEGHPAWAANAELCRAFHRECTEARAAGYRDVGICNVERLECPVDGDARAPERSHEPREDDRHDPERAVRERSIGP